ncbi:MAG: imidazole glycerol phosphate synthase subunit HisH [Oscillospiraceae bacterium]|nr:imidazole glycerol phosphate synthase subunit HisH [Oscillospiraceae bacterium]
MIAIVDYGVGNLFSLARSFAAIGVEVEITADPDKLRSADKILLPGVGAFGDAADKLRATGLDKVVVEQANAGKPLMGICLGMQLLFDEGLEYGCHKGLGLIPGKVISISEVIPQGLKIPHMGWNGLNFRKKSPLLSKIKDGDCVYFVHSFCAVDCDDAVIATAEYGAPVTAAVQKDNVFGCQFHPEKSGTVGLNILRAFAEMEG